uniref:exodeoxyribonuclease VII large subunit n=1 Tax=Chamaesiphon sp. GL140_3_metabinner_50 TaxID=2970812 RepID=UPI0025EDDEEF
LQAAMQRVAIEHQSQLDRLRLRCERIKPDRQLALEIDRLHGLQQRLQRAIAAKLQTVSQQQLHLRERCQTLDPRLVLQRGYALVRQTNGTLVRDGDRLVVGEELAIQLGRGRVKVNVIEVDRGEEK